MEASPPIKRQAIIFNIDRLTYAEHAAARLVESRTGPVSIPAVSVTIFKNQGRVTERALPVSPEGLPDSSDWGAVGPISASRFETEPGTRGVNRKAIALRAPQLRPILQNAPSATIRRRLA